MVHASWPNPAKSDSLSHPMVHQHDKEVIHQNIPHNTCLFGCNAATTLEFGDACLKETLSITGEIHKINDIA
jgi:hypothetical protein